MFTVNNGHAVKHIVQLGLQSKQEVEVMGGGIKVGDMAVLSGNYELKPGMAVSPEKPR